MKKHFTVLLFLLFVSALAYLPFINQFGYFRDDWYLMYSANALGVKTFQGIFAIDRPARILLMTGLYSLFGMNPLYYNIAAYLLRVLGALSFFWTLRLLWPRQRIFATVVALLFLIYPGFLSTPNAIDYQEKYVGLLLGHLSVALSVQAVLSSKRLHKILLWIPTVVFGGLYLTFVEYYFGLEVFRLLAFILLAMRASPGKKAAQWAISAFYNWIFFSIGSLVFFIWRFFIFDSERKATDLGAQLSLFVDSPLSVGISWVINLLKDTFEALVLTWGLPLATLWDTSLRLREIFYAGLLVALGIASVAFLLWFLKDDAKENHEDDNWKVEAIWVGLICVITGFVPVILSNRQADFYNYSRYMLPSSSGVVLVLIAVLSQLNARVTRNIIIYGLVGVSILTHHLNGIQWARSSEAMQNFWWQVSWRIPQLQPKTTLVANYSHTAIEEDYFIWGPANLLYHPQSTNNQKVQPALWGLVLNQENTISILNNAEPALLNRRSIITYLGYDNILILTQPTPASCVQVIDGTLPFVSEYEQDDIHAISGESNLKNIVLDENPSPPLEVVFGTEPEHEWCYYYQTASLAFQRRDYETVLDIKQKAKKLGFSPEDPVEWMPFLHAALLLENYDEATEISRLIKKSPRLQLQVCTMLANSSQLNEQARTFAKRTFCQK